MKNYVRFIGFCGILGIYSSIALIGAFTTIIQRSVKKAF